MDLKISHPTTSCFWLLTKWHIFQYFNQILTAVLEMLDDSDSSIRELALTLIVEMLKNQVHCLCIT